MYYQFNNYGNWYHDNMIYTLNYIYDNYGDIYTDMDINSITIRYVYKDINISTKIMTDDSDWESYRSWHFNDDTNNHTQLWHKYDRSARPELIKLCLIKILFEIYRSHREWLIKVMRGKK